MGSEFGQDAEWAESRSLDWWHLDDPAHRGILQLVTDLTRYKELDALWSLDVDPAGFQWIDANDATGNVLSFLRYGKPAGGDASAGVTGSAPGRRSRAWRTSPARRTTGIGSVCPGRASGEVLNSDAEGYGGSGVGNLGGVEAVAEPWHGQPFSATQAAPAGHGLVPARGLSPRT